MPNWNDRRRKPVPAAILTSGKKAVDSSALTDDLEKIIIVLYRLNPYETPALLDRIEQEAWEHRWKFIKKTNQHTSVSSIHLEYAYDHGSMKFVREIMKITKVKEVQIIKSVKGGR